MGKAVAYFLKRWDDFTRYTQSGALPIDNAYASWCTFGEGSLWDLAA
jgi:hypothetical protein